jgi:mono/diheme cytochrome c family protein
MRRRVAFLSLVALLAACSTPLPDPTSAGAQVYQVRCAGCHRVYEPGLLTAAMWEMQIDRMQEEMTRRGVNPLTAQERHLIMSYLRSHSSDAAAQAERSP